MENNIKVSIITVCRNELNNISFTIDSVLRQNPDLYEFLILDGKSDDGTIELIKDYEKLFIEKNIDYTIVSEKDSGIYNAMNKGIRLAKNQYCIFMNGGDGFYNDHVIEDAIDRIKISSPGVLYGNSLRFDDINGSKSLQETNHKELLWNCTIAHQSSFIKTALLKERNYDESYSCAADYEYWLYLLSKGVKFEHADQIYSYFRVGGVSTFNYKLSVTELENIQENYTDKIKPEVNYNKNNIYNFKQNADTSCKFKGWSFAEATGTWAVGKKSLFCAYMKKINCHFVIKFANYFKYDRELFLNDKFLANITIENNTFECCIKKELINDGLNVFSFITLNDVKRCDNPVYADYRRLNMLIEEIRIMNNVEYFIYKLKSHRK